MRLEYFDHFVGCEYPVGLWIHINLDYIKAVKEGIYKIAKKRCKNYVHLIVRGTSGCILAGAVASELESLGLNVKIVTSRKTTSAHGSNMEGINHFRDGLNVVLDDFIGVGNTLRVILKDIEQHTVSGIDLHLLCVSNCLSYDFVDELKETEPQIYDSLVKFNTILCNNRDSKEK